MRSPATSRLTANPDSRHVVTAASGYRKFRQRPWRSRTDSLLTVCSRPESRGSRPPTEALKLSLRPAPAQPAGSTTRRGVRGGQGEEPAWDRLPSPSAAGEGQGHTRSRSTSRGRAPQLPERQPHGPHRASATGTRRQRAPAPGPPAPADPVLPETTRLPPPPPQPPLQPQPQPQPLPLQMRRPTGSPLCS